MRGVGRIIAAFLRCASARFANERLTRTGGGDVVLQLNCKDQRLT
jgi:hypothetical protein